MKFISPGSPHLLAIALSAYIRNFFVWRITGGQKRRRMRPPRKN